MDPWRFIADRKIREAMEEGAFDHLEGTGRPIPMEDSPYTDPTLWMAHHVMKNNGLAPSWVLDGNEIEAEIERLRQLCQGACSSQRLLLRDAVAAVNRRIADFNLKAPAAVHKLPFTI